MIQLGIAAALGCLAVAEYMRRKSKSIEESILAKVECMLAETRVVCSECHTHTTRVFDDSKSVLCLLRKATASGVREIEEAACGGGKKEHQCDDDYGDDHVLDILDMVSEDEGEDGWLIPVDAVA